MAQGKRRNKRKEEEQLDLFNPYAALPGEAERCAAVVSRWNSVGEDVDLGKSHPGDREFNEWWAEQRAGGPVVAPDAQTDFFKRG